MTTDQEKIPHIYLIAGEESGDRLGGSLMHSLKKLTSDNIQFSGVGGKHMTEEGIDSIFPIDDLAVMGITEVLPRIPLLIKRIRFVVKDIKKIMPDVVVTIDAPDFNFRVARSLTNIDIPLVHYVAPTVWAWRSGRAKKISRIFDHLLTLLPFEPPYFECHGLTCTYVGHPILTSGAAKADNHSFRTDRGIKNETELLAIIPGSRKSEVSRHLPIFGEAAKLLYNQFPNIEVIVPTLEATREMIERDVATWPMPVHLTENDHDKYAAFATAEAAIAASGTVTLELAITRTPTVTGYKMAPATAFIAKRLVKVIYSNLVNLILNRDVVPEFLLDKCKANLLADTVCEILNNQQLQSAQKTAFKQALSLLVNDNADPNRRASEAVLGVLNTKSRNIY